MTFFNCYLAFVYIVFVSLQPCQAECYHPDGSDAGSAYQPCHTGGQSMCCALNQVNGYSNRCRPDNLCFEDDTGLIFRESCTDPTWKDPACLQLCTSGFGAHPLAQDCYLLFIFTGLLTYFRYSEYYKRPREYDDIRR